MFKTAQQRSFFQKLKEKTDIGGRLSESFNEEMKNIFNELKEHDKNARGKAIEHRLGEYIKSAKSNLDKKDFISCVYLLSEFHTRVADVISEFEKLKGIVDRQHRSFVLDTNRKDKYNLDPMERILKEKFETKKSSDLKHKVNIIKTAGLLDKLKGVFLASKLEKIYPKQTKKLKQELKVLLNESEKLFNSLMKTFYRLGDARAARKIEEYVEITQEFMKQYSSYDVLFKKFYKENVAEFLKDVQVPEKITQEDKKSLHEQLLGPAPAPSVKPEEKTPSTGVKEEAKRGTPPLPLNQVSEEEQLRQHKQDILQQLSEKHDEKKVVNEKTPEVKEEPKQQAIEKTKEQDKPKAYDLKAGDAAKLGSVSVIVEKINADGTATVRQISTGTELTTKISFLKKE